MSSKFFKDVSASTIQVIVNQVMALAVFFLTSLYLPKEVYGEFNWSIAVMMFVITVISLRLEQIVVKKSAVEGDSSRIMTLFMIHGLLSGVGFYIVLIGLHYFFPSFFSEHSLLLLIAVSQLISYFSSPFKQVANGKERFDLLAMMSSVANFSRAIGLIIGIFIFKINVQGVILIFIISSCIEFSVCYYLISRTNNLITSKVRFADYINLLRESLPQIGSAILIAGISRMDWILLGIFSTSFVTAEYSFAYRVYELSPFPLLIIAPILLSRFSRFFSLYPGHSLLSKRDKLGRLIRYEMVLAGLVPLILNIIWTPLMDAITNGKYGAVNQEAFLILSFCIPFQYISNLLWSAHFAQNHLKLILKIAAVSFAIILVGDLIAIPIYNANGAALVYLVATIVEYIIYMCVSDLSSIRETWKSLVATIIAAVFSGFGALALFDSMIWELCFAIPVFFVILIATRELQKNDIRYVLNLAGQKNEKDIPEF